MPATAPDPIRKVVLPAAGLGTRLRPLTQFMPKEMLPVGGQVVLQYVMEECAAAGLDQVLAILSASKLSLLGVLDPEDAPREQPQDLPRRWVHTILQKEQRGLGHALLHAEAFVGADTFAVALPDTILHGGPRGVLAHLVEVHRARRAAVTLAIEPVPPGRAAQYGIVRPAAGADEEEVFAITDLVEKPRPEDAPSNLAICARYVFEAEIFEALRQTGQGALGEIQLTDAIGRLARSGRPVFGVRLAAGQRRLDIGTQESYFRAFELLKGGDPE
jgi:UTP--glucose-1-phosphate uridylyltransferase